MTRRTAPNPPDDDYEAQLRQVLAHRDWRNGSYARSAAIRLKLFLDRAASEMLGHDRPSLAPFTEPPDLTLGAYFAIALEFSHREALDAVFRFFHHFARRGAKGQDWPTILRRYAHAKRAIVHLLPHITSSQDWTAQAGRPLCRRLEAAGLKTPILTRRRRAPTGLAAALVAYECRQEGDRVEASTILKMWKQREREDLERRNRSATPSTTSRKTLG